MDLSVTFPMIPQEFESLKKNYLNISAEDWARAPIRR